MLIATAAMGCSDGKVDDTAASDTACNTDYRLTWDSYGDQFFHTWCRSCHSENAPQRFDAPESVNFDTEEDVITWKDRVQARVIDEKTMPLGGGISDDELATLQQYLDCSL